MDELVQELVNGILRCTDRSNELCSETLIRLAYLSADEPEIVWQVILQVIDRRPSDEVLGMLGAGPLEDLMWNHGREFIDRVEQETVTNHKLRGLLSGIYRGEIDDETWARIVRLSGREREMYKLSERSHQKAQ